MRLRRRSRIQCPLHGLGSTTLCRDGWYEVAEVWGVRQQRSKVNQVSSRLSMLLEGQGED